MKKLDAHKIAQDFTVLNQIVNDEPLVYLDNAATTMRKPASVISAVTSAMENCASVGRSGHGAAMNAAERVFRCRTLAAKLFDAEPEQVAFTFNATHGLNIAIHSLIKPGDHVVVSGFEHNAVMRPLYHIGAQIDIAGRKLFDPEDTLADFKQKITPQTKAVICTHVSNVFGYILPVEQIAVLCRERGVPFILDASQSAGTLPVSMKQLGAAFIAMPGHKGLYGPQGTGILLCSIQPEPILQGGTGSLSSDFSMPEFMPDRIEAGTHNVPGICGLEAGMMFVRETGMHKILMHERDLVQRAAVELREFCHVYFDDCNNQAGVISLQFNNLDCEEIGTILAANDIAVRAGLHCAPKAHESAGTLDEGTVRLSFCAYSTNDELTQISELIKKTAA